MPVIETLAALAFVKWAATSLAVGGGSYTAYRLYNREYVDHCPSEVNDDMTDYQRIADECDAQLDDFMTPDGKLDHNKCSSKRGKFVVVLAAEAKVKFGGTPKFTTANKLAVSKYIVDRMTEHGMRPTHVMRYAPIATSLTFLWNQSDVWSAQSYAADAHLDTDRAVRVRYARRAGWWDMLFGNFGKAKWEFGRTETPS